MRRLRLTLLVLPLLLAGCDSFGDGFFDDDYLSVYRFTASDGDGVVTEGEIGLTRVPSDVGGVPDLWKGLWDLDAQAEGGVPSGAVDGRGSIRGSAGKAIEVQFYADVPPSGPPEEPLGYFLIGTFSDDGARFVGRWETRGGFTGGVLRTGSFEAIRTRRATEFIVAG